MNPATDIMIILFRSELFDQIKFTYILTLILISLSLDVRASKYWF